MPGQPGVEQFERGVVTIQALGEVEGEVEGLAIVGSSRDHRPHVFERVFGTVEFPGQQAG